MSTAQLIGLAIQASIFLLVFSLGVDATLNEVTHLFRNPGHLVRSVVSTNFIMLAFAILIVKMFQLPLAIRIALVALSVSPVPPILPFRQVKAGGSTDYAIGLLAGLAVISIVLVPLEMDLLERVIGIDLEMPASKVATIVLMSIVIPLLVGIGVRAVAPGLVERIARPASLAGTALLVIAALPILFLAAPAIWSLIGNGVLMSLIAFSLIGLAVGHMLGGPDANDRTVLALATATRHPGLAIAIAKVNFPEEKAVMAVVMCHLIVGGIVALPYINWRARLHARPV
jgi:BASS family bile acid:Na+ symporter